VIVLSLAGCVPTAADVVPVFLGRTPVEAMAPAGPPASSASPVSADSAPSVPPSAPAAPSGPRASTSAPGAASSGRVYVAGSPAPMAAASSAQPSYSVPASTPLAYLGGSIPRYPYPGAASDGTVPATWYGYQSILPVVDEAPGWVEVRLAQRPNMSVTWVRAEDVQLDPTPYHLVLDLASMHLLVFQSGQLIYSFPAGVGTPDDPTPTGTFFVAFQAPPPNAGYGPFMFVTSAHSDAISDWEGEGDAIIALHGPITARDDARIGTTGARISHGCVRLHDADLARIASVPPGTPLDIVN
jgi:hypothetical protein